MIMNNLFEVLDMRDLMQVKGGKRETISDATDISCDSVAVKCVGEGAGVR